MRVKIHPSWKKILHAEFDKTYFKDLAFFVKLAYKNHKCYPKGRQIFAAFDYCHFEELRVVILGQDPYHGFGQANGLCFSVCDGTPHPPSLSNIFKEISKDLEIPYPKSGNLEPWAKQGVLLLNATLTVQESVAGSHQNRGWETFTDSVIQTISQNKESVVFMLWGAYAKQKIRFIDTKKHLVITSGHPSPLSANRGLWFGNKHFSKCNDYLLSNGQKPIEWQIFP